MPTFPTQDSDANPNQKPIPIPAPRGRYDSMLERAFAPPKTPESSPKLSLKELNRLSIATGAAASEVHSAISPPELPKSPVGGTLEPIWEKVRQAKERRLAVLPSKVKSLEAVPEHVAGEGVEEEGGETGAKVGVKEEGKEDVKSVTRHDSTKRPKPESRVSFKESEDGSEVTATIEMYGVKREDMHVSFRGSRIVVTWRKLRTIEKQEDGVLVRERFEKQYSQIIQLPDGTKFEEIKAARDGRRLMVTYPTIRSSRLPTDDSATVVSAHDDDGATEFFTCLDVGYT